MVRGILTLALLAVALGCGGREQEAAEMRQYVLELKKIEHYNEKVEQAIVRFDDPTIAVTMADIQAVRTLIDDYHKAVVAVVPPDESKPKSTHGIYIRAFDEAKRLAADETGDIGRQAHSVAIGLRTLRREIGDRAYPTLSLLLSNLNVTGDDVALSWPASE
jgi:hypothetical protein